MGPQRLKHPYKELSGCDDVLAARLPGQRLGRYGDVRPVIADRLWLVAPARVHLDPMDLCADDVLDGELIGHGHRRLTQDDELGLLVDGLTLLLVTRDRALLEEL